jgi:ABC-type sulfate transport system substrate-binding protein
VVHFVGACWDDLTPAGSTVRTSVRCFVVRKTLGKKLRACTRVLSGHVG